MGFSNFFEKVVIVTGAGRGIGRACAEAFAAHGARVALLSRTRDELEATAVACRRLGGLALPVVTDIANEAEVGSAIDQVEAKWGLPHYLINNAGVFAKCDLAEMPFETWKRVFDVNIHGMFLTTREVFRRWRREGVPHPPRAVVQISSLAGIRATEKFRGTSAYAASKFAVVGFTESAAVEGRTLNVRVNCIAPGAVKTKMLAEAAPTLKTDARPEHIAQTILSLCDETLSGHVQGSTIELFTNG